MTSRLRFRLGLLGAAVMALGFAPGAEAYVYWANFDSNAIARANLDSSGANQAFITGASGPTAVATDGAHVYWANEGTHTIGRANLDGSGANQSFITGATLPRGLAVDDAYIYWSNYGANTIGRANLDGSAVDQSFIGGAKNPRGIAVDATRIYWANYHSSATIGVANIDGGGAGTRQLPTAFPIAVAVNATHLYWTTQSAVGRQNLDGTGSNANLATADYAYGVAVDAAHVYWTNYSQFNTIGRANLDGSAPSMTFISGAIRPYGLAVDALAPDTAAPVLKLSGKTIQKAGPSVTVTASCSSEACTAVARGSVKVPGAGSFKLGGANATIAQGAKATLKLGVPAKARKAIGKVLTAGRKVKATVKVTARDAAGNATTRTRTVTLRR